MDKEGDPLVRQKYSVEAGEGEYHLVGEGLKHFSVGPGHPSIKDCTPT